MDNVCSERLNCDRWLCDMFHMWYRLQIWLATVMLLMLIVWKADPWLLYIDYMWYTMYGLHVWLVTLLWLMLSVLRGWVFLWWVYDLLRFTGYMCVVDWLSNELTVDKWCWPHWLCAICPVDILVVLTILVMCHMSRWRTCGLSIVVMYHRSRWHTRGVDHIGYVPYVPLTYLWIVHSGGVPSTLRHW